MSRHYGQGIIKGMKVTLKNLVRGPITVQYPEEKLNLAKRERGISLAWNPEKCIGCYTCEDACPHHSIHIETSEQPKQLRKLLPCIMKCPAKVEAAKYVRAIATGNPEEALSIIREQLPLPSACAYVCAHPCESACTRKTVDNPVAIRKLKRYAVEHDDGRWMKNVKQAEPTGKSVAIIGAGPAGLTAAYYLLRKGHKVTVFDELPKAGGMMLVGIPRFRLPEDALMHDVKVIEDMGCEFKFNTRVEDPKSLLGNGFDSVLLATGAHEAAKLGIPGEDNEHVLGGVYFLKDVALGKKIEIGNNVVIVGGGNTAMDCCRTAVRLGAKNVFVLYRRTRNEMPADSEEIDMAIEEGVDMQYLASPVRVFEENGQLKVECKKMELGPVDASGRRSPVPIEGSEYIIDVDTVISASSQYPIVPESFGVKKNESNSRIIVDRAMATDIPGIYAAGDNVLGSSTVIQAVAQAKTAAKSIDTYLGGDGNITEVLHNEMPLPLRPGRPNPDNVHDSVYTDVDKRITNFECVEECWDQETAEAEANRCLRCDLQYEVTHYDLKGGQCVYCGLCVESCPFGALFSSSEYERATYTTEDQVLHKEHLIDAPKSSYYHSELDSELPDQSLLLDIDKEESDKKKKKEEEKKTEESVKEEK